MNGLIGLTENTQDRESKIRELGVLERMSQSVEQEKAAEIQAQQQEQMFYEKMYQTAESMLGKDRERINKKIIMAQQQVRKHLSETGGSRKNFLAEGGMSVLGNLKNQILESDEAFQYKENAKNLAKILEIKEKGLGHLLAPRDLESAENYEKNPEGGAITYSGMMTEVKIPEANKFRFGQEIPINNILSYDANMVKIMGNYKIQNPEAPELDPQNNPKDYMKIVAFAKKMGYGGTGSNTTIIRQEAADAKARAEYEKKRSTKDGTISYLNELNVLKSQIPAGITVKDINEKYNGNLIDTLSKNDPSINKLLGGEFKPKAYRRSLSEEGFDITDIGLNKVPGGLFEKLTDYKLGLKESRIVMEGNEFMFADAIFGEEGLKYKLEGGKVLDFTPDEDMYRMDGVKLTGENKLDPDDHKGNFEVVGVTTAMKSKMASDGTDALLVNAYDNDGELNKEATSELDEKYTGEMIMTTVVAMEDKDGNLFYKEIDLSKPHIKTKMSSILANYDDLTDTVEQENASAKQLRQIEKLTKDEQIMVDRKITELDSTVFDDEIFKTEGSNFYGENSGGQENRYKEMKSFYMAFDYVANSNRRDEDAPEGDKSIHAPNVKKYIDQDLFTKSVIAGGVEQDFQNYEQGNSSEKLIEKWIIGANKDLDKNSLDYQKNLELAAKWKQILNIIK